MANTPVAQLVLKFKGGGNVQVFPLLAGSSLGTQDGLDAGTGGPGLATIEAPVAGNFAANRAIEYLNDRYALAFNNVAASCGVYKKNQGGADQWGRVSGGPNSTPHGDGSCSGLHVLHPAGVPTLAFLQRDLNGGGNLRVRRTVDGVTGANWVSLGLNIEAGAANPASFGQSIVFGNSIVWAHQHFTGAAGAGAITQYDLVTATLTRYNVSLLVHTATLASGYTLHVHDNVLFLFGWNGTFGRVMKLSGGAFVSIYLDANQSYVNTSTEGHSAMFTDAATGDLILIMAERNNAGGAARAKVVSFADATGAATPTDRSTTVMGATEGADKYLEGGASAARDRRWSVFVDTITDPTAPRTYLTTWIPGGSTETWEWKGVGAEMELVGAGAGVSDSFALPYNTAGGGHRSPSTARISIGDTVNPPVEVAGGTKMFFRGMGSAPAGTLTFRGIDDRGAPDTIVPISPGSLTIANGLLTNIEGYWKLNSSMNDSSGLSRNLTASGVEAYDTGKFGQGYDLPGNEANFATAPDHGAHRLATANYTIQAWVNPTTILGANRCIFEKHQLASSGWIFQIDSGGGLRFYFGIGVGKTVTSAATIPLGVFTHVAVRSDGDFVSLYINGVLSGTPTAYEATPAVTALLRVGDRLDAVAPFDGVIDELAIWSRTLAVSELAGIYNAGVGTELADNWSLASISGNTIINMEPDEGNSLYSVVLDTGAAGVDIDEGDTGLLIAELI